MGLKDRFRIDELVKKGSKAIPRDERGGIRVRKRDGRPLPPGYSFKEGYKYPVKLPEKFIPYGKKPIKSPNDTKKFKADFVDTLPPLKSLADLEAQKSFGGETSGFIEKPNYDESELKKAIDVKVDELIKPKKVQRGDFIPKPRYTSLEKKYEEAQKQIKTITSQRDNALSSIASLEGEISSLQSQLDSCQAQLDAQIIETEKATDRYSDLLKDFQTSLIKGTKEGIERASLSAQAQGLQAQKETLQAQLASQQDIVKSLQNQQEIQAQVAEQQQEAAEQQVEAAKQTSLLGLVEDKGQFQVKGTVGWALHPSSKNIKPEHAARWDDRRKGAKGRLTGLKYDWYNLGEEAITLSVTETVINNKKWLTGVPSSLTIPASPDGGSTPGKKTVTFGRGSIGKGTYETEIEWTNTTTNEKFKMKTRYWQARRRRKT